MNSIDIQPHGYHIQWYRREKIVEMSVTTMAMCTGIIHGFDSSLPMKEGQIWTNLELIGLISIKIDK